MSAPAQRCPVAKLEAMHVLNALQPDVYREMIRACIWQAWRVGEPAQRIVLNDVPIIGLDGKLGYLADLELEEMVATVVEHSTFARSRRSRQADAYAALAAKEYEALPQIRKEKTQ